MSFFKFMAVWIPATTLVEWWLIHAHLMAWHNGLLFQTVAMVLSVPVSAWFARRPAC
jgi:hypothetical protein